MFRRNVPWPEIKLEPPFSAGVRPARSENSSGRRLLEDGIGVGHGEGDGQFRIRDTTGLLINTRISGLVQSVGDQAPGTASGISEPRARSGATRHFVHASERKEISIEELLATEATRWDRRIASDLAAELETQLAEKLETIPEIRRLLAVKGYRELRARLERDIGNATGSDAIRAMALAMRAFAHERPGLSAATFRNPTTDSPEWRREGELLAAIAVRVFESAGLNRQQAINALQILRALVRGLYFTK
jgi:hypothetical protein